MEAILQTESLTKFFGGLAAVSNLNIVVRKGEIVGLIGPNGSGKTTVINMVSGHLRATSGRIVFKGQDITELPPHLVTRLGIGRTFQQNLLFNGMTVLQNFIIGQYLNHKMADWEEILPSWFTRKKQEAIRKRAMEALEFLGLSELKDMDVKQTPHGMKRLFGVGLALSNSPELMLFDEPLSGMNAEEIDKAIQMIQGLRDKGMTILIIEHNMRAIMRICDRLVVLNYGKKIAEGHPEEIAKNAEVIQAYLGSEYATT